MNIETNDLRDFTLSSDFKSWRNCWEDHLAKHGRTAMLDAYRNLCYYLTEEYLEGRLSTDNDVAKSCFAAFTVLEKSGEDRDVLFDLMSVEMARYRDDHNVTK
jgi:hypothetical protein